MNQLLLERVGVDQSTTQDQTIISITTVNGTEFSPGSIVQVSKGLNGQCGQFRVVGGQTGRLSSSQPNLSNTPRPASVGDPLLEARNLIRRGNIRGKRLRGKPSLRILDHGSNWKQQGCGSRFKVLRWRGPTPSVWTNVGWHLSDISYHSRKEAYQARKELMQVAEVMDS